MSTIVAPGCVCFVCRLASIPPPGGDLGFVMLAGYTLAREGDPVQLSAIEEGMCAQHRVSLNQLKDMHTGLYSMLGLL